MLKILGSCWLVIPFKPTRGGFFLAIDCPPGRGLSAISGDYVHEVVTSPAEASALVAKHHWLLAIQPHLVGLLLLFLESLFLAQPKVLLFCF